MEQQNGDSLQVVEIKGLRNDKGQKFISGDYLFKARNLNYDDTVGCNKILCPDMVFNGNTTDNMDGIFEFSYLDNNNQIVTENIEVYGGNVYKDFLDTPILLLSGLTPGKVIFSIYQNKLFLTNGLDFPKIYNGTVFTEMGAPVATVFNLAGNLNGNYYYAQTYVTAAGEEVIGTISNVVSPANQQVTLSLPLGYTGTTSRKIYRTTASGTTLKLVATIADNTTLTYTDNIADGSLGADIPATNKECPKPRFLEVSDNRLCGAVSDINSTYVWPTDQGIEVWDLDVFQDLSLFSNKFSPVTGIKLDYSQLVAFSNENIYLINTSVDPVETTLTRANVGCQNGYSISRLPKNGDFPGGLMFLSNLNDYRIFNGNIAQPVPTSLDNLNTENMSQAIRETINEILTPQSNIFAEFFDYKYHCIVDNNILIFDIRLMAWSTYIIQTSSYTPLYNYMAVINNYLYIGQFGSSIIERFYTTVRYRDEEITMFLQTPQLVPDDKVKYFKNLYIYYITTSKNTFNLKVALDGDYTRALEYTINLDGGAFDSTIYDSDIFETDENNEDYRVLFINRWARWIEFQLSNADGVVYYRAYTLTWNNVSNKE